MIEDDFKFHPLFSNGYKKCASVYIRSFSVLIIFASFHILFCCHIGQFQSNFVDFRLIFGLFWSIYALFSVKFWSIFSPLSVHFGTMLIKSSKVNKLPIVILEQRLNATKNSTLHFLMSKKSV